MITPAPMSENMVATYQVGETFTSLGGGGVWTTRLGLRRPFDVGISSSWLPVVESRAGGHQALMQHRSSPDKDLPVGTVCGHWLGDKVELPLTFQLSGGCTFVCAFEIATGVREGPGGRRHDMRDEEKEHAG